MESCRSVLLPAPLGPSRPVTPGPIVIVTSLTATTLPYHREACSTCTRLGCTRVIVHADVKTEEKSLATFGGMLGRMVNLFGGRGAKEGVASTVAVSGDRKYSVLRYITLPIKGGQRIMRHRLYRGFGRRCNSRGMIAIKGLPDTFLRKEISIRADRFLDLCEVDARSPIAVDINIIGELWSSTIKTCRPFSSVTFMGRGK